MTDIEKNNEAARQANIEAIIDASVASGIYERVSELTQHETKDMTPAERILHNIHFYSQIKSQAESVEYNLDELRKAHQWIVESAKPSLQYLQEFAAQKGIQTDVLGVDCFLHHDDGSLALPADNMLLAEAITQALDAVNRLMLNVGCIVSPASGGTTRLGQSARNTFVDHFDGCWQKAKDAMWKVMLHPDATGELGENALEAFVNGVALYNSPLVSHPMEVLKGAVQTQQKSLSR